MSVADARLLSVGPLASVPHTYIPLHNRIPRQKDMLTCPHETARERGQVDETGQVRLPTLDSQAIARAESSCLNRIEWQDPSGKVRIWESCERPTRPRGSDIDAVGIVAILEKPTGEHRACNWAKLIA